MNALTKGEHMSIPVGTVGRIVNPVTGEDFGRDFKVTAGGMRDGQPMLHTASVDVQHANDQVPAEESPFLPASWFVPGAKQQSAPAATTHERTPEHHERLTRR
jgi:hypothetical protein